MSYGLEALEVLKNRALSDLESIPKNAIPICEKSNEEVMKTYETIKQALTELKAIKEAKPSEALRCVGVLKEEDCITTLVQGKALETIRQYILKAQEQEKVLKIIKEKEVNVNTLVNSIIGAIEPLEFYNEKVSENLKLTQQEYELLKEVLENE